MQVLLRAARYHTGTAPDCPGSSNPGSSESYFDDSFQAGNVAPW